MVYALYINTINTTTKVGIAELPPSSPPATTLLPLLLLGGRFFSDGVCRYYKSSVIILFASSTRIFHTRGERATVVAVISVVIVDITGDALDVVSLQAR